MLLANGVYVPPTILGDKLPRALNVRGPVANPCGASPNLDSRRANNRYAR